MLRDLPIKVLLIGGFLFSGLIPLMAAAILGLSAAESELTAQAFKQLESVCDLKKSEIERFFDERVGQVSVLAADPYILEALEDFERVTGSQGPESGLRGKRNRRFEAPPAYREIHARHFGYFQLFNDKYEFYDLFLMDEAEGFTFFTVQKEEDFGIPIEQVDSSLRDVWRIAARDRAPALSDTRPYKPSGNIPAQFIAAPVIEGGQVGGVVAAQISIDSIDEVMTARSGMGKTGETFLVGPDFKMRSDSALDPKGHSVLASFNGTVSRNGADTEATRRAFEGRTGSGKMKGADDETVLYASAPVKLPGVTWAIVAQIDEAEIEQRIGDALDFKITVIIAASIVLLLILALSVSVFISGGADNVINKLSWLIDQVLAGKVGERLDSHDVAFDFRGVVEKTNELNAAFVAQTQEKRKLEEVIQYNQRMESIGTLAGGIAHDFNNILTYMFNYVDLVTAELSPDSKAHEYVEEISSGIERAGELVAQIMLFGRQMKREKKPVKIALIVKESIKLLRATLPKSIRVVNNVEDDDIYVMADPTQVHQVVMNLCTNAYQAMQAKGGVLTVSLREVRGPGRGDVCELVVSDTGEGIPDEIRDSIFEPFFTTKPVGQGTGMGLAVVHGIVTSYEGSISYDSAVGRGTTATVLLPAHRGTGDHDADKGTREPTPGRGVVLFVDDEEPICDSAHLALTACGYRVVAVSDPLEAVSWFAAHKRDVDVVVTDLSMPGLDGVALAEQIKALRGDVPVIMTTGYFDLMSPRQAKKRGAVALLTKPYRYDELSRVIAQALAKPSFEQEISK